MVSRHDITGEADVGDPADRGTRRPWSVLVLLSVAQFMVILDMTVVTVALPSIGRSLRFAAADLQWVVTAYLLATGGLTLLGGRGARRVHRRVGGVRARAGRRRAHRLAGGSGRGRRAAHPGGTRGHHRHLR